MIEMEITYRTDIIFGNGCLQCRQWADRTMVTFVGQSLVKQSLAFKSALSNIL